MTRQQIPKWVQQSLLGGLAIIFVLLPVNAFLSTWGGTHIGPLWLWKSTLEILLAILSVIMGFLVIWRFDFAKIIFGDNLWRFTSAYGVLVLVLSFIYMQSNQISAMMAGLAFDLRYLAVFFVSYGLFRFGKFAKKDVFFRFARYLAIAGAVLGVVGLLQVTVVPRDFLGQFGYEKGETIAPFMTIDEKNPEFIRAFATTRGPNDYGALLVLCFFLVLALPYSFRTKILLALPILLGVFLSASRSAVLGLIVGVIVWGFMTYRHVLTRSHVVGIAIGLVVAFGLTLALALSVPTVRLLVFHSSPDDTHLTEGNVDAHSSAIAETVDRVVDEPLGCGSGCSGPASFYSPSPKISENYYLQIAEQYGIIGLVLWLAVVFTTFMRILRFRTSPYAVSLIAFLASASVIGLLLHVWADPAVSIAWWAMAGAFIGYNEGRLWTKSKDSSRSKT